jgi:hypothetical protein
MKEIEIELYILAHNNHAIIEKELHSQLNEEIGNQSTAELVVQVNNELDEVETGIRNGLKMI